MKKILILFLLVFLIFLVGCSAVECKLEGGEIKRFGNTCVDSCSSQESENVIVCGDAITWGCDCGEDKCWNGETCETLP